MVWPEEFYSSRRARYTLFATSSAKLRPSRIWMAQWELVGKLEPRPRCIRGWCDLTFREWKGKEKKPTSSKDLGALSR